MALTQQQIDYRDEMRNVANRMASAINDASASSNFSLKAQTPDGQFSLRFSPINQAMYQQSASFRSTGGFTTKVDPAVVASLLRDFALNDLFHEYDPYLGASYNFPNGRLATLSMGIFTAIDMHGISQFDPARRDKGIFIGMPNQTDAIIYKLGPNGSYLYPF